MQTIGERIFAARKLRGLTQAALASLMGVSDHQVLRWEKDQDAPSAARLAPLGRALDVPVPWLLEGGELAVKLEGIAESVPQDWTKSRALLKEAAEKAAATEAAVKGGPEKGNARRDEALFPLRKQLLAVAKELGSCSRRLGLDRGSPDRVALLLPRFGDLRLRLVALAKFAGSDVRQGAGSVPAGTGGSRARAPGRPG